MTGNKFGLHASPFGHVYYGLFLDSQEIKRFYEKHGIQDLGFVSRKANGTTIMHKFDNGDAVALVCMHPSVGLSVEICGVIVHEAAHVWQFICAEMGEDEPGHEFEAYSLQWIVHDLIEDYGMATNSERMGDEA